ncbi:hypothetical protein VP01_711g1 [Puccinia sorghi]|uniref:Uncharacterized protein n=1 Tax=Puccinia sorghi TaxID=27349 RepID=A0A0L6UFM7_9BASI|nr:hypothetical protein VP01_711g1 [Puccinia sorghi]
MHVRSRCGHNQLKLPESTAWYFYFYHSSSIFCVTVFLLLILFSVQSLISERVCGGFSCFLLFSLFQSLLSFRSIPILLIHYVTIIYVKLKHIFFAVYSFTRYYSQLLLKNNILCHNNYSRGLCQKYGPHRNTSCTGLKEPFKMVEGMLTIQRHFLSYCLWPKTTQPSHYLVLLSKGFPRQPIITLISLRKLVKNNFKKTLNIYILFIICYLTFRFTVVLAQLKLCYRLAYCTLGGSTNAILTFFFLQNPVVLTLRHWYGWVAEPICGTQLGIAEVFFALLFRVNNSMVKFIFPTKNYFDIFGTTPSFLNVFILIAKQCIWFVLNFGSHVKPPFLFFFRKTPPPPPPPPPNKKKGGISTTISMGNVPWVLGVFLLKTLLSFNQHIHIHHVFCFHSFTSVSYSQKYEDFTQQIINSLVFQYLNNKRRLITQLINPRDSRWVNRLRRSTFNFRINYRHRRYSSVSHPVLLNQGVGDVESERGAGVGIRLKGPGTRNVLGGQEPEQGTGTETGKRGRNRDWANILKKGTQKNLFLYCILSQGFHCIKFKHTIILSTLCYDFNKLDHKIAQNSRKTHFDELKPGDHFQHFQGKPLIRLNYFSFLNSKIMETRHFNQKIQQKKRLLSKYFLH